TTPTWGSDTSTRSAHSTKHKKSLEKAASPPPRTLPYQTETGSTETHLTPSTPYHMTPCGSADSAAWPSQASSHWGSPPGSPAANACPSKRPRWHHRDRPIPAPDDSQHPERTGP